MIIHSSATFMIEHIVLDSCVQDGNTVSYLIFLHGYLKIIIDGYI